MIIPKDRSPDVERIQRKNQIPKDDICKALQSLNIQEDGKKRSFINIKSEIKNESNDDVGKLTEKLSDVKIEGDKENCLSQNINCAKNTFNNVESNDHSDKETKVQNTTKSVTDTESSERIDLKHTSVDEEDKQIKQTALSPSENEKEIDINVKDVEEEKEEPPEEIDKVKESDNLCCRAPLRNNLYRHHDSQLVYSRSHQSGGTVEVAETTVCREQSLNIPFPPQNCQNYNIVANEEIPRDCDNLQAIETNTETELMAIIANDPVFIKVFEEVVKNKSDTSDRVPKQLACTPQRGHYSGSCSSDSSGYTTMGNSNDLSESEWSPRTVDQSPIGSPREGSIYNHPSPPSESSSGVSSVGSPRHNMGEYLDNPEKTYTQFWVSGINKVHKSSKEPKTTIAGLAPLCPKPPAGKVDPNSAKSKLIQKLNVDRTLIAWSRMQAYPSETFVSGDVDGDTQLMILVCNACFSQLELIYSMVERMRNIPNSLSVVNRLGHSALYLACSEMKHEPIVAAYIAEAMMEQSIDLTKLTYDNGKTIPQILEAKGDSHKEILRELLNLKKSNSQFVFQSYRSDINGNV